MKILVTGGAGFIGSNITDRYIELGHEVVVVDDLSTGKIENVHQKARFYKLDICDAERLEGVFQEERPDIVNHHAAQMDVRVSVMDPILDARINVLGTINLLENCKKYKVGRFIFASSGGVLYGEVERGAAQENWPIRPLCPYGVTKFTTELYLQYYSEVYGLRYVVLRYGNVYGPRQNPHGEAGVVAIFLNKLLRGDSPTIYGDGTQERDYIYIEDVVEVNCRCLNDLDNLVLNIGTSISTSVNGLFRRLKDIVSFQGKAVYAPKRTGELQRSCLNVSRMKEKLGFSPAFSLDEGLRKTAEYFQKDLR